ncbi:hypothetical protein MOB65_19115 [Bacillus inaquosorum]|uniref:hypothetical protein n=1 Tax=Bacillus inaquosorum TaxID=483913 RepID=UPI00227F798D|nr:hypothetical protein [Bacillus inaquosorum]MCY7751609.1 hypothetical protein [Bacillus inaquosorum]MCY7910974.1 hypothetical protein [Bacillus inaquosorum]
MRIDDDFINRRFTNNRGQSFVVIEKVVTEKGKANRYKLRFEATGYETTAEKVQINRGTVKDRFERSVFGVGFLGNTKMVNNKAAYSVWNGMLERCYDTTCTRYKDYGGAGVRVCDRWHCFETFLKDLQNIEGYDARKFKERTVYLDKDIKQKGVPKNKMIYSVATCCFVTRAINNANRNMSNARVHFVAKSPDGEIIRAEGLRPFAEKYELHRPIIKKCLRKEREEYDGWKFELIKESNWGRNKSA